MTTINSQEDFLRTLTENPEWRAAVRAQILGDELLQLPAQFNAFVERMDAFVEEQKGFNEEMRGFVKEQKEINARLARNMDRITHDIGQLRGWFARLNAAEFAPVIAWEMDMEIVRVVPRAELIRMVRQGMSDGTPRTSFKSFYNADVIIEATTVDGAACYIAVEASYTADHRDADRALRNASLLTQFTGLPAHPAIVSVRNDRELDPSVLQGNVFWYPIPDQFWEPD